MSKSSRKIGAAKFKEQCLSLLDQVDREGLIITKNGKPVARLIPYEEDRSQIVGKFSKSIKVTGSTLSTGVKWDAES